MKIRYDRDGSPFSRSIIGEPSLFNHTKDIRGQVRFGRRFLSKIRSKMGPRKSMSMHGSSMVNSLAKTTSMLTKTMRNDKTPKRKISTILEVSPADRRKSYAKVRSDTVPLMKINSMARTTGVTPKRPMEESTLKDFNRIKLGDTKKNSYLQSSTMSFGKGAPRTCQISIDKVTDDPMWFDSMDDANNKALATAKTPRVNNMKKFTLYGPITHD